MIRTDIHDLFVHDARVIVNDKGSVHEVWSADLAAGLGLACGQTHLTFTKPGVTRAWFRHQLQSDSFLVVQGRALVAVFDDRPLSPSFNRLVTLEVDERVPLQVVFGAKLWHGFRNIGAGDLLVAHVNDRAFKHAAPDEEKLPITDPRFPPCWA